MQRKKLNYIILVTIPFIFFLLLMIFFDNFNIKIVMYAIDYLFLILTFLKQKKYNILSMQFLFTVYHMAYIGLCPIFLVLQYTIMDKKSSLISMIINDSNFFNQQCLFILISYYIFLIATTFFSNDDKIDYSEKNVIKMSDNKILHYSKMISIIMIGISFILEALYLAKNKSLLFGGSLESGRITAMAGNGIFLYGMWLGTFGLAMLYEIALRKKFSPIIFWIICIIHMFSISLIGFKSRIIVLSLFLLLIHNRYKKIKSKNVIKLGIVGIFLVGALTIARNSMSGVESSSFIETIVTSFANGSINIYYVLHQFPKYTPFQYGYAYLINFIMLAPGSQPDFTIWLKNQIGIIFSGGGVTPTLLGEAWLNFGFLGIIMNFFLVGLLCNRLDNWYYKTKNVYFVVLFVWVVTSSVRGGFANSLINLVVYSIMNLILFMLFKKSRRW